MQSVIETQAYLAAAKACGMSEADRMMVVDLVAAEPRYGTVMEGTAGCRKFRIARPGSGKSGGYRIVTVFGGGNVPVFLLTVFGKNEKANLSKAERNALAALTRALFEAYRGKVKKAKR